MKKRSIFLPLLICLAAAFFACGIFAISTTKDKGQTVTAHAETEITPTIYWSLSGSTLTLSSSSLSSGTYSGSFDSDTEFDNDTIFTPYFQYANSITTVNISTPIAPAATASWFYGLSKLTAIENIANLDTSNVDNMGGMFQICSGLTTLDLSNFDTSNVIYFSGMFSGCSSLVNLNVSNWNLSSGQYFHRMFNGCSSLKTLNLSNWKCSGVIHMLNMFRNCSALEAVDLSGFDVSHSNRDNCVNGLFQDATSLKKVKLSDSIVANIASGKNNSYLTFPLYDVDGNKYNSASEMTKGGAYFKTKHTHDYKLTSTIPATCVDTGEKVLTCSEEYCADVQTETIPATGVHSFTNYVSDNNATCYADGTKTATCDNCTATKTITDTGTATGNHSFTNYVSNNDATCTEDGTKTAQCDTSGCTATETITDTGTATGLHSFTNYVSDGDADCLTDGHETATCDSCHSATDKRVEVDSALGHDFSITVSGTQPTCQQGGSAVMKCSRCTETETQTSSSPVGHKYTNYLSNNDATCTADGTKTAQCDFDCGTEDTITDTGSATGHTPGTAATCTEPQTCDICGTELAAALGHTEVTDEAKAPTCTETGLTEGKHCGVCDTVITAQEEVPALGHNYEWVITKEPTVDETGLMENLCTVCGHKDGEEEIAKLIDPNGEIDLPVDINVEFKVTQSSTDNDYSDIEKGLKRGYWAQLWYRNEDGTLGDEFTDKINCFLTLKIPTEIIEAIRGGEEINRDKIAAGLKVYYIDGEGTPVEVENFTIAMRDDDSWQIKFNYNEKFRAEVVFAADLEEQPTEPENSGIPWWVWLIVGLVVVAIVGVVIVIIVVAKKKNNDGNGGDTEELKAQLAEQGEKIDELLGRDDGGFNTPVELDENGNVIFK